MGADFERTHVSEHDLLSAIAWGATTASELGAYLHAHFRAVDRALQRARKRGLIKFANRNGVRGWAVVEDALPPAEPSVLSGNDALFERGRIVAWLREVHDTGLPHPTPEMLAESIDLGEHMASQHKSEGDR